MDALSLNEQELLADVLRLPRRIQKLRAVIGILLAVLEVWHVDLGRRRVPDGGSQPILLRAIQRATGAMQLRTALAVIRPSPARFGDGGGENVNGNVDELIESGLLHRVIAMTELTFSTSMIEAWWRALKHQWLFLNTLDSLETEGRDPGRVPSEGDSRRGRTSSRTCDPRALPR